MKETIYSFDVISLCFYFLPKIEFGFWLMKALYTSWHPCAIDTVEGSIGAHLRMNTGCLWAPLGMMCGQGQLQEDLSNLGYELRRYSKYQVIEYLKLWKTREI